MCNQLWLHFRYCPHILMRQRSCHDNPDLSTQILFCQDYQYDRKLIRDACPKADCQRGKAAITDYETFQIHKQICAIADQKTMMREAYGLPDQIQERIDEIDAIQLRKIEEQKAVIAARIYRDQVMQIMAQRQSLMSTPTYDYPPSTMMSTPPVYLTPASSVLSNMDINSMRASVNGPMTMSIGPHEGHPEHRGYQYQPTPAEDETFESSLLSTTLPVQLLDYYGTPTPMPHPQRPSIRFGAHGGIVSVSNSQLGSRAPTVPMMVPQSECEILKPASRKDSMFGTMSRASIPKVNVQTHQCPRFNGEGTEDCSTCELYGVGRKEWKCE